MVNIRRNLDRCLIGWSSWRYQIYLIVLSIGSWGTSFESAFGRLGLRCHFNTLLFRAEPTTTSAVIENRLNNYCGLFDCRLDSSCRRFDRGCELRHPLMSPRNITRRGSYNSIHAETSVVMLILSSLTGRYLMDSPIGWIWLAIEHNFFRIWFSPFVLSGFAI
jgi:hypothetical protein